MKKMICMILALIISFSLALPTAAATKSPEHRPSNSDNPKTGDVITVWAGCMSASAAGLAIVGAMRKKEQ